MATTVLHISEIVSDPNIRGGKPVLAGTTLKVSDVVLTHTTGDKLPAETIASNYGIPLGQVYAALAYYHLHQTEIDTEIQADGERAQQLAADLERQGKLKRID